jgi:hypothetical protein
MKNTVRLLVVMSIIAALRLGAYITQGIETPELKAPEAPEDAVPESDTPKTGGVIALEFWPMWNETKPRAAVLKKYAFSDE